MVTPQESWHQHDLPLVNRLAQSAYRDHAAFYAPGHKQGQGAPTVMWQLLGDRHALKADLPELPELDNLFAPEGVIQAAQALAAAAFGANQTWFLTNGSTCGIEAAILATCGPGDRVLLPRNVHRSAILGLILSGAMPIFVDPDYDPDWDMAHGVAVEAIAHALKTYSDIKAILIVSPTYYGTCADVGAIAHLAHQHNIPLIVDEAHGPHFGFHPDLPASALSAGADIVIQSTHKVLSAMTQASMLHLGFGGQPHGPDRVQPQRISAALQLVQSTSPNYLLLASLDAARHQMATDGHKLMQHTLDLADYARTELQRLIGLRIFAAVDHSNRAGIAAGDRTRLTVDVSGLRLTGFEADDILHTQLGVTAELPTQQHLTFIISLGNTRTDIDRLIHAFQQLQAQGQGKADGGRPTAAAQTIEKTVTRPLHRFYIPTVSPRDAFFAPVKPVAIAQAIGHISGELICPYPPGIPLIMPGEVITAEIVEQLRAIALAGGVITGCADASLGTLGIIDGNP
ncbi:MAG: aminotransferase class I/II-fold pyridoxal phosphate-dependent enzyme [Cyanothece sp. SIO2G6]|nr:aminotransferase class I/II-fold pyridoxal phosphate-dependent enzyme [Cyanothece sp. SIO2G6]